MENQSVYMNSGKIKMIAANGNLINEKDFGGLKQWCEYDSHENLIHEKASNGLEHQYNNGSKEMLFISPE